MEKGNVESLTEKRYDFPGKVRFRFTLFFFMYFIIVVWVIMISAPAVFLNDP